MPAQLRWEDHDAHGGPGRELQRRGAASERRESGLQVHRQVGQLAPRPGDQLQQQAGGGFAHRPRCQHPGDAGREPRALLLYHLGNSGGPGQAFSSSQERRGCQLHRLRGPLRSPPRRGAQPPQGRRGPHRPRRRPQHAGCFWEVSTGRGGSQFSEPGGHPHRGAGWPHQRARGQRQRHLRRRRGWRHRAPSAPPLRGREPRHAQLRRHHAPPRRRPRGPDPRRVVSHHRPR
mmetsp:Transcript_49738/g.158843  ORF Transcript_49738/g.158843 Transcript_49738/m.158843 type:complete len:232 (+) Transcript_49738:2259-2954(+)